MNRLTIASLFALGLLVAACNPSGPSATASHATADVPPPLNPTVIPTKSDPLPAPTATTAQVGAGQVDAQAAVDALADERMLLILDFTTGPDAADAVAARRLTQADPDLAGTDIALTLTAAARTAVLQARSTQRSALESRVATETTAARTALRAALATGTRTPRKNGGAFRTMEADLKRDALSWHVKLIRAYDAEGTLIHSLVRATAGNRTLLRTWTATTTGGASVKFSREVGNLKSAWTASVQPDGLLSGAGVIAVAGIPASRALIAKLKGTSVAPQVTLTDLSAKLEAEVTLPLANTPTKAVVTRLDAAGERVAVSVQAP